MQLFLGNSVGQKLPLLTVGSYGEIISPHGIGKAVQRLRTPEGLPELTRRGFIKGAAAVSALAMLPRKAHAALVDDAVALWLCDDAAGGTMADSTINGNDGTLEGTATWNTIGGEACLQLTAAGDRVNCGDLAMHGNDLSIMFRARFTTAIPADMPFIDKYLTTGSQRSWHIKSQSNGRVTAQVSEDGIGNTNLSGTATGNLVLDTWANFTVTLDGDGAAAMAVTVYKNDTTNSTDNSPTGHGFMFDGTGNLYIGSEGTGDDNNLYIRHIVLLTSVATAQQITDHDTETFGIGGTGIIPVTGSHTRRRKA
ncbi:MAG TPA: twin-arginine translocation signal domain-containing protein [Porticoccus sp.]|nr:twin-arginine translocation signal domain-containing protein [Porticoccus sp.]